MKPLPPGTRRTESWLPAATDTADAGGNTGVYVVSSPAMILFLENVCSRATEDALDPGEVTVGIGFDLKHVAPGLLGSPIDCEAVLAEQAGRRLTFDVTLRQNGRVLMHGRHQRAAVPLDAFLAAAGG